MISGLIFPTRSQSSIVAVRVIAAAVLKASATVLLPEPKKIQTKKAAKRSENAMTQASIIGPERASI